MYLIYIKGSPHLAMGLRAHPARTFIDLPQPHHTKCRFRHYRAPDASPLMVSSDRVVVSRGPDMQVDATRADAGTAAARLLKTALQQSIKSTSEAPKAVPKPLKTVQGPPPEFKPRKDINMGYSIGESSVPPLKG